MAKKQAKEPAHEVGAATMRPYIVELLKRSKCGYVSCDEVKEAVYRRFSPQFTRYDHRKLRHRNSRKWENNLAWAQAVGQRLRQFATIDTPGGKYIVNLSPGLPMPPMRMLMLALNHEPENRYVKMCEECGRYSPLGDSLCVCGEPFPEPLPRI